MMLERSFELQNSVRWYSPPSPESYQLTWNGLKEVVSQRNTSP